MPDRLLGSGRTWYQDVVPLLGLRERVQRCPATRRSRSVITSLTSWINRSPVAGTVRRAMWCARPSVCWKKSRPGWRRCVQRSLMRKPAERRGHWTSRVPRGQTDSARRLTTYVLSPRARRDLSDIWDYSAEQWSAFQADRCVRLIAEACEGLASGRIAGRSADTVRAGYFRHPAGSPRAVLPSAPARRDRDRAHPAPAHGFRAPTIAGPCHQ
jgi:plasmid stabilization system protein ParE